MRRLIVFANAIDNALLIRRMIGDEGDEHAEQQKNGEHDENRRDCEAIGEKPKDLIHTALKQGTKDKV